MKDDSDARPAAVRSYAIVAWTVVVLVSGVLLTLWHAAVSQPYVSLDALARFEERAPFQYRMLVPLAVAIGQVVTRWSTPTLFWVVEACAWIAIIGVARVIVSDLRPAPAWWSTRLIALTVVFPLSAELMLPSRFRVFAGDVPLGDVNGILRPLSRIAALPNLYYPWDVPAAVFVLVLVACVLRLRDTPTASRTAAYLAAFMLASFNRETAIVMVPLSVWAVARHWPAGRLAAFAGGQIVLWAGLMAAIVWSIDAPPNAKADLPGGSYEWYLWTNLRSLTYPLYVLTTIVPLAAGAWLPAAIYWRAAPDRARALALAYVAPSLAAALTFGVLHETRIFTEASAAIWVVAVLTVHSYVTGGSPDERLR